MNLATLMCANNHCSATFRCKPEAIDQPIDIYTRWIDALDASDSGSDSDNDSSDESHQADAAGGEVRKKVIAREWQVAGWRSMVTVIDRPAQTAFGSRGAYPSNECRGANCKAPQ